MSVITCKGHGTYLVENDGEFKVHFRIESDIKNVMGSDELRRRVNNALLAYDTCVRTCAFLYNDEIHFKPSNFTPWTNLEAELICRMVQVCGSELNEELRFTKRVRQVRDAFNKCKDPERIKQIAKILGV